MTTSRPPVSNSHVRECTMPLAAAVAAALSFYFLFDFSDYPYAEMKSDQGLESQSHDAKDRLSTSCWSRWSTAIVVGSILFLVGVAGAALGMTAALTPQPKPSSSTTISPPPAGAAPQPTPFINGTLLWSDEFPVGHPINQVFMHDACVGCATHALQRMSLYKGSCIPYFHQCHEKHIALFLDRLW